MSLPDTIEPSGNRQATGMACSQGHWKCFECVRSRPRPSTILSHRTVNLPHAPRPFFVQSHILTNADIRAPKPSPRRREPRAYGSTSIRFCGHPTGVLQVARLVTHLCYPSQAFYNPSPGGGIMVHPMLEVSLLLILASASTVHRES